MERDDDPTRDDLSKRRFALLGVIRLAGAAVVVFGVANIGRRWIEPADTVGSAMLLVGAVAILLVPRLIVQRWKRDG